MAKKRKIHSPEFKAKVALEAIKEMKTASELTNQFRAHPILISSWKKQALIELTIARGEAGIKNRNGSGTMDKAIQTTPAGPCGRLLQ